MLTRLLSYRPVLMFGSLLLWTAGFCVPIITGLVNQAIFDELTPGTAQGLNLWLLFAALVVIAVVQPALMVSWRWMHATFETTLEALVRTNLFTWIVTHADRNGKQTSPVTLLGHLRDDVPGHTDLVNEWYRLTGEATFVVIALVIMVRIDPTVTALTFLPLAGVVLFTHWMRARLPRLWSYARETTTTLTDFVGEVFACVQAVKVAGAEAAVVRRLASLNQNRCQAEVRSRVAVARIEAVTDATVIMGHGLVLLVGAGAMLSGRFSIGDFILFTIYLEWMLDLPRRLGRLLSQRKTSQKSLDRLREAIGDTALPKLVEHRPVYLSGALPDVDALAEIGSDRLHELVVDSLSYTHPETGRGIADTSLRIRRGTVTVITGAVGSGKSTLLEVLLGLRDADAGEVRWNGAIVTDLATFMVPPRVGYKPQVPRVFSESLLDTILLGLPQHTDRLNRALHRAAFDEDIAAFEEGLATMVGSRGVRLSGGQLQRATAARMFVREPELYVIDDLSSALDDRTERQVWDRIDTARAEGNGTYLVVSHRPAALHRADQIIVLEDGRVQAAGPLSELRDHFEWRP